jgi:diacylglycerol kinase family enzyme
MYVYLYDNLLKQKRYDAVIKSIETRLTDFGIAGKIIRLQQFTNVEAVLQEEIKKGIDGVVIVGNDQTVGHVLSRAATLDTLFGFIPVGTNNAIAEVLGIPVGVEACDVLSRRRKVSLDVGWFNGRYFVSQLYIPLADITIEYDERFVVSSQDGQLELVVCNLKPFSLKSGKNRDILVHPQDGKLEAFLRPGSKKGMFGKVAYEDPSVFPFEEMVVWSNKAFVVEADGKQSKETHITIRLAKDRINMIVGKDRKF